MALARVKVWVNGEVLTAPDLNGEFNNLLNNALSLVSPLTGTLDANSNQISNLVLELVTATGSGAPEGKITYHTNLDTVLVSDGANVRFVPTLATPSRGDLIYAATASHGYERLPIGTAGFTLQPVSGAPAWATTSVATANVTGVPCASGTGFANLSSMATQSDPIRINDGPNTAPAYSFTSQTNLGMYRAAADTLGFAAAGTGRCGITASTFRPFADAGMSLGLTSFRWSQLHLKDFIQGQETATPSAPPANGYIVYATDSGGGKTRLMVRFNTGAEQVIATEP